MAWNAYDQLLSVRDIGTDTNSWRAHASPEDFVLESWSQGFLVGSLVIMACITISNMRRGVLLHKLILLEQLLAMCHGTFCFMSFDGYGWYLSSTAALLYSSYILHNFVAWLKVRPFFVGNHTVYKATTGVWVSRVYVGSWLCTIPPTIFQIFNNFRYFNNINNEYAKVRPYEALFRDPWWVFTCLTLFEVIRKCYGTGVLELVNRSPRFGILLVSICLAMAFTTLDITNSVVNFIGSTDGINPWWKLSLVFKCLTDTIMLDDFKTELRRLGVKRMRADELRRNSTALVGDATLKDANDEVEFADALNVDPARYRGHDNNQYQGLHRPSTDTSLADNSSRELVGKKSKKISNLPGLKMNFDTILPVRGREKEEHDLEKQDDILPPQRCESEERKAQMRRSLGIEYKPPPNLGTVRRHPD